MAKKKRATSKPQTSQVLSRLQANMKAMQRDAETLLSRTRKQATQLISRDQRRALDRLFKQAQRLRTDFEKRAQRASKDVESRAERFLSTLEKQTAKRLDPLLRRLDVPSRREVHSLARRIGQLERQVRARRAAVAEPPDAHTPSPVRSGPPPTLPGE
ncbi:MAG: phasin family protein [Candidatus Binatia bacterium]